MIVATPLTLCNPFERQNETERSFIAEKVVIVAVPILTSGAMAAFAILAFLEGSALGWLIPVAITGGIATGSGLFTGAVFSVAFTRLANQEKDKNTEENFSESKEIKTDEHDLDEESDSERSMHFLSLSSQEEVSVDEDDEDFSDELKEKQNEEPSFSSRDDLLEKNEAEVSKSKQVESDQEIIDESEEREGSDRSPFPSDQENRDGDEGDENFKESDSKINIANDNSLNESEVEQQEELPVFQAIVDTKEKMDEVNEMLSNSSEEVTLSKVEETSSLFPFDVFQRFVDWCFGVKSEVNEKKGLPTLQQLLSLLNKKIKLSPKSQDFLNLICMDYPFLMSERHFAWLGSIKGIVEYEDFHLYEDFSLEEDEINSENEDPDFIELKQWILNAFRDNWKVCAQGYPEGFIEDALMKLQTSQTTLNAKLNHTAAIAALYPFFLRFYCVLGDQRKAILSWYKEKARAKLLEKFSSDSAEFDVFDTLYEDIFIFLDRFNCLLGIEDYEGKAFLAHIIRHYAFDVFPNLIEKAKKIEIPESRKKRLFEYQKYHAELLEKLEAYSEEKSTEKELSIIAPFKQSLEAWGESLELQQSLPFVTLVRNRIFSKELFPFLGHVAHRLFETGDIKFDKKEIRSYLERLKEVLLYAKEKKDYLEPKEPLFLPHEKVKKCLNKEVEEFGQLVDSMAGDLVAITKKIFLKDLPLAASLSQHKKHYQEFLNDFDRIVVAFTQFLADTFEKSVQSPGEYIVKTFLISDQLLKVFPHTESRIKLVRKFLDFCMSSIEQAGIKTDKLKEFFSNKIDEMMKTMEKIEFDKNQEEALRVIPFHDLVFVLLAVIFMAKHLHLVRPWLAKHQKAIIQILMDSGVDEITQNEKAIKSALKTFLAFMKPLNGLFLGGYVGKSSVLSGSITLLCSGLKKLMIRDEIERLKRANKPIPAHHDDLLTEHQKILVDLIEPVIKFLLLGLFGSEPRMGFGGKEKKAFGLFESRFVKFYQNLYGFDVQAMTKDKDALRAHIREKFETLLDNKSS